MKNYVKFLFMIFVSTVVMYFLMFFNTYSFSDVFFSRTRMFMAIMMGGVMSILMMSFMYGMYQNKKLNLFILMFSAVISIASLTMVRTQYGVGDVAWMKAMIPHHSIAILTSSKADLKDPRVKDLANRIIATQISEISEMKGLINELENK